MTNSKAYMATLQASERMQNLQRNSFHASLLTNIVRDEYLSHPGFHIRQANYSLYNMPQLGLYIERVVSRGRQSGPSDTHDGCHFRAISKCTSWPMSNPRSSRVYRTSCDKYTGLATIFPRARGNQACSVPHLPPGPDVRSLDHGAARHESEHVLVSGASVVVAARGQRH